MARAGSGKLTVSEMKFRRRGVSSETIICLIKRLIFLLLLFVLNGYNFSIKLININRDMQAV